MTNNPFLLYEVPSLERKFDNWEKLSDNREETALCWTRSRWKEIKLLEGLNLPHLYCTGNPNFKFYDPKGNRATISGLDVFPMSFLNSIIFLMESISKEGGNHIVSPADFVKIVEWIDCIDKSFLKRRVSRVSKDSIFRKVNGRTVLNKEFVSQYAKNKWFFLKSEWKQIAELPVAGRVQMDYDYHCDKTDSVLHRLLQVEENIPVLISEPIALEMDREKHPKLEYRCWVTKNQVTGISRYVDYDMHKIPSEVEELAKRFVESHKNKLPAYYVVDIGVDINIGPLVIELNPISTSGRYIKNDFGNFLKVLYPNLDDKKIKEVNEKIELEDKIKLMKLK